MKIHNCEKKESLSKHYEGDWRHIACWELNAGSTGHNWAFIPPNSGEAVWMKPQLVDFCPFCGVDLYEK